MQQMNVNMVGTTDDPVDSLKYHRQIADDTSLSVEVAPSWRPDKAFKIELDDFAGYMQQLGEVADIEIRSFPDLLTALEKRIEHFSAHGCRAADHGIEIVRYAEIPSEQKLTAILLQRLAGHNVDEADAAAFSTAVQVWLGHQYAKRGWVMQLHIGAQRNNNSRMFNQLGADSGYDSIGDRPFAWELSRLLDEMDKTDQLPKTILYCLNPETTK